MKAEGLDYDQRMEQLEKLEYPKPMRDFVYGTFNAFADRHPWVGEENIRPKSIAREMFEGFRSFSDYVQEYDLERAEGLLLRHLNSVYKVLGQTVPDGVKTDTVREMELYLRDMLRGVDSSLLDEWERMRDPDYRPLGTGGAELRPPRPEEPPDVTRDVEGVHRRHPHAGLLVPARVVDRGRRGRARDDRRAGRRRRRDLDGRAPARRPRGASRGAPRPPPRPRGPQPPPHARRAGGRPGLVARAADAGRRRGPQRLGAGARRGPRRLARTRRARPEAPAPRRPGVGAPFRQSRPAVEPSLRGRGPNGAAKPTLHDRRATGSRVTRPTQPQVRVPHSRRADCGSDGPTEEPHPGRRPRRSDGRRADRRIPNEGRAGRPAGLNDRRADRWALTGSGRESPPDASAVSTTDTLTAVPACDQESRGTGRRTGVVRADATGSPAPPTP